MMQINLWNPFFRNTWKEELKLIIAATADSHPARLYKTCEMNGCSYAIRLKQNSSLSTLASDKDEDLYKAAQEDQISYAVTYGEFMYQAGSWEYPRRMVFEIEKPYGQLTHMYNSGVTIIKKRSVETVYSTKMYAKKIYET